MFIAEAGLMAEVVVFEQLMQCADALHDFIQYSLQSVFLRPGRVFREKRRKIQCSYFSDTVVEFVLQERRMAASGGFVDALQVLRDFAQVVQNAPGSTGLLNQQLRDEQGLASTMVESAVGILGAQHAQEC